MKMGKFHLGLFLLSPCIFMNWRDGIGSGGISAVDGFSFNFTPPPSSLWLARLSRKKILATIGGVGVSIPLLLETYARSGCVQSTKKPGWAFTDSEMENIGKDVVKDITVIFHGAGGEDAYTDDLLKTLCKSIDGSGTGIVKMINWEADSADILQASIKGTKIGKELAKTLCSSMYASDNINTSRVANIHAIGISVGAFAADSFLDALSKENKSTAKNKNTAVKKLYCQLTLLDPFQQKAVLGVGYGNKYFGIADRGVDYAQQYLNTDDPVPSTNAPLQHCATIDVTALRPPEIFGHDWPLVYYTEELKRSINAGNGFVPTDKQSSRGSLKML